MKYRLIIVLTLFYLESLSAQVLGTSADSLRGSLNANRTWWDVVYYDLTVEPNISKQTISGSIAIKFKVLAGSKTMQIDLQQPLKIKKITHNGKPLTHIRKENVAIVNFPTAPKVGNIETIIINYDGKPKRAVRAPWDGGLVWEKDDIGRPFVNTACQGLGASVWWPCKDHQTEEPDSMQMTFIVPNPLVAVGNGRLRKKTPMANNRTAYTWFVSQPINNYNATMNIAHYTNFSDTMHGEKGKLDLNYYVLDYNIEKAKKQFQQVKPTLRAFEYWFGPYPFYEDSYKLVETHHLGMEHQSAVAYGNKYQNGYLGSDLSGTGWGKKWDYIIVHETGHEWFGNNITTEDVADMWIHEGFTTYSETLFTDYHYGKSAGDAYCQGTRMGISNLSTIIGEYGINKEGSSDMYPKGGNLLHTIRTLINDDVKFREILRGLNKDMYHSITTTQKVEQYISQKSGIDFSIIFDQYLRHTKVPTLQYKIVKQPDRWVYEVKFVNCIKGFSMKLPIDKNICINEQNYVEINDATTSYLTVKPGTVINEILSKNIYVYKKEL